MPFLTQNSPPKSCHHFLGGRKLFIPPWRHFFENLSLVNSKKWWRKLETWVDDTLHQNSVRKLKKTWNIRFFIFCMIYNFFKCDGFTILQIISIIMYGNNLLLLLCNDTKYSTLMKGGFL